MKEQSKRKRTKRRRRWWFYFVWLLYVCLLAEGGIRLASMFMTRATSNSIDLDQTGSAIYCIGDSFTYGQGVRPDETYPRVLQGILNSKTKGKTYRVVNLGSNGLSGSSAIKLVANTILNDDVKLIILMVGWNANNHDFERHAEQDDKPIAWTTRFDNFCENSRLYCLAKHVVTIRQRTIELENVELVPMTTAMDLYNFRDYQKIAKRSLERIIDLCRRNGTPLVLATYPHREMPPNPHSKIEYYHVMHGRTPLADKDYIIADREDGEIAINSVIRHVAQTEGVPLIDMQKYFDKSRRDELFQSDYHHPTAAGQRLMAQAVAEAIVPSLE